MAFTPDAIRKARGSLRRYVLTPAVICTLVVAAPVVIQDNPILMYSPAVDNLTGAFCWTVVIGLIWLCVRAVRFSRLRRKLTVVADAADGAAVVGHVAGRKLWISTTTASGPLNQEKLAKSTGIRLVALRGQRRERFLAGDRVRLYRRWTESGPTLVTDGSRVLVGWARRAQERIADPLAVRYPRLFRQLRWYRTSAQIVPVVVGGASIAVVIAARLNPAWIWLPVMFDTYWLIANLVRYYTLSPILRGPYVVQDGLVHAIVKPEPRWAMRSSVVIIDRPEQARVQVRPVGGRRVSWLIEGRQVAMFRTPGEESGPVLLAAPDGQAKLAMAKPVKPRPDTSGDSLGKQYPALRAQLRRSTLVVFAVLIIVCGAAAAITLFFDIKPGWLWAPATIAFVLLMWLLGRIQFFLLLHRPYVAHQAVVVGRTEPTGRSPFRAAVVTVEMADQPLTGLALIGGRDVSWLSEGQDVVVLELAGFEAAVLASAEGRAALARASTQAKAADRVPDR